MKNRMTAEMIINQLKSVQEMTNAIGHPVLLQSFEVSEACRQSLGLTEATTRIVFAHLGKDKDEDYDEQWYFVWVEGEGCAAIEAGPDLQVCATCDPILTDQGILGFAKKINPPLDITVTYQNGHPQAKYPNGDIVDFSQLPAEQPLSEEPKFVWVFPLEICLMGSQSLFIYGPAEMEWGLALLGDDQGENLGIEDWLHDNFFFSTDAAIPQKLRPLIRNASPEEYETLVRAFSDRQNGF